MISDIIFIIQIIVTIAFCIIFSIFDIMKGFIPDKLNYSLLSFGILSNLILTILTNNLKFIFFSIISWSITFAITTLMWKLEIWGGGDVKLFASIASVIPFGINISFLNISPTLSFYPFSFTVMINSILVSFPVLMIFLIYLISKNGFFSKNKSLIYNFLNYKNLKFILDSNFNKHILIKDLNEGMMINNQGESTINYPRLHAGALTQKHQQTLNRFKPLVRVLKNIKTRMVACGYINEKTAASYYIEGWLYNAPNDLFAYDLRERFEKVCNWLLRHDDITQFMMPHGQFPLIGMQNNQWASNDLEAFSEGLIEFDRRY